MCCSHGEPELGKDSPPLPTSGQARQRALAKARMAVNRAKRAREHEAAWDCVRVLWAMECCDPDHICPSCTIGLRAWLEKTPDALASPSAKLAQSVCQHTSYVAMARMAAEELPAMQFTSAHTLWDAIDRRDDSVLRRCVEHTCASTTLPDRCA